MDKNGSNKRIPLIVLLVIFVICSVFVCVTIRSYLSRAHTSFFIEDFYSTEISFSEDIVCISQISLVNYEIEKELGNEDLSEIKPVTFQKGKKYKLKSKILVNVLGRKRKYEDQIGIYSDDGQKINADLYSKDGKIEEFHNEWLDGTYYTGIPMSKVESYEELLSAYKKAKNDLIASDRGKVTLVDVFSVIVPVAEGAAIFAVFLLLHKLLTERGLSATPLVVILAIIDAPVVLFAALLLYSMLRYP